MDLLPATTQTVFPVADAQGRYRGLVGLSDIRQFLYERPLAPVVVVHDLMNTALEPLRLDTDLSVAMVRFAATPYDEVPVVSAGLDNKVLGLIRRQDMLAAYNARTAEAKAGEGEATPRPSG
jgi:CIC family chloride channel protein